MSSNTPITIVEVGPRDGFQPIGPFIGTERKIALIDQLYRAGLRRIEATAFVSPKAVPQMADAAEVLQAAERLDGLQVQVLVPNERYCQMALEAGARAIAFVLSASEAHNRSNVKRSPAESIAAFASLSAGLPSGIDVRLNLATAFDCPFDGSVAPETVLGLLDQLVAIRPDIEIALCDTTGRATPDRVGALFTEASRQLPKGPSWVFHGHDTYGLGVANALAAYGAGVRAFDASIAGLGGCPFAPGATGNVATEDLVWTFEQMGIATGLDLNALIGAAEEATAIEGAAIGGRVRTALTAARCRTVGIAA